MKDRYMLVISYEMQLEDFQGTKAKGTSLQNNLTFTEIKSFLLNPIQLEINLNNYRLVLNLQGKEWTEEDFNELKAKLNTNERVYLCLDWLLDNKTHNRFIEAIKDEVGFLNVDIEIFKDTEKAEKEGKE